MPDANIDVAALAAFCILLAAALAWPKIGFVRAPNLAGFWADQNGQVFQIGPGGGRDITVTRHSVKRTGELRGLRALDFGGRRGRVALGTRRIDWGDGDEWTLQGVR
jgi:hypothetical protein